MRRRGWVLLATAVVASALLAPGGASAVTSQEAQARSGVYTKLNRIRAKNGLAALTPVAFIENEAYTHSKKQARSGAINHNGFDGRKSRIDASDPDTVTRCENVAFVSGGTLTPTQFGKQFVRMWKASPPHLKCMLDKYGVANEVGVGIKKSGAAWYATLITANDPT